MMVWLFYENKVIKALLHVVRPSIVSFGWKRMNGDHENSHVNISGTRTVSCSSSATPKWTCSFLPTLGHVVLKSYD